MGRNMQITEKGHNWEVVANLQDDNLRTADREPPYEHYVLREEAEDRLRELQEKIDVLERTGGAVRVSGSRHSLADLEARLKDLG